MLAKSFMCNVLKSLLNGLLIKMNFVLIIKKTLCLSPIYRIIQFINLYTNQRNKTALLKPCFVNLKNAK